MIPLIFRKRRMGPRLLTRTEGFFVALVSIVFAIAGVWAFWLIHPLLSISLTAFLIWMALIYHSKVCIICPHTNCPFNPRYWEPKEDQKIKSL